jgi:hypothetical protein
MYGARADDEDTSRHAGEVGGRESTRQANRYGLRHVRIRGFVIHSTEGRMRESADG